MEHRMLAVSTTLATADDAARLAREILQARLAACVQVEEGLRSFYRWDGRLCDEPEVRLLAKTLPHCRQPLEALLREHHPYELPQFVAWELQASADYHAWARGEVIPQA